jgi:virulence-associated protein VagC
MSEHGLSKKITMSKLAETLSEIKITFIGNERIISPITKTQRQLQALVHKLPTISWNN